jgi:hypothetical protein
MPNHARAQRASNYLENSKEKQRYDKCSSCIGIKHELSRSEPLQLRSRTVASSSAPDRQVRSPYLFLVAPRKSEYRTDESKSRGRRFSAKEMRHNFAIWKSEDSGVSGGYEQFYFCVRCKWTFGVNGRSSLVTPLRKSGEAIQGPEAWERLETFANGPCPVLAQLVNDDCPMPPPGSFLKDPVLAVSGLTNLARVFSILARPFSMLRRR